MRSLLRLFFLLVPLLICCQSQIQDRSKFTPEVAREFSTTRWDSVRFITERIKEPVFPAAKISVLVPPRQSGTSTNEDMRASIQSAIDSCHQMGGGTVAIQAGSYFMKGPIHLRSNVHLHLDAGAKLIFSDQYEDYLPLVKVRWEGTVCWNFSPMIYAYQAENIALTGSGEIDGQGKTWSIEWRKKQRKDKDLLRQMGNDLVPEDQRIFGNGYLDRDQDGEDDGFGDGRMHYLRPTLVEWYECKNILIEDLIFRNAAFWTIHPVFSKNIKISNVQVFGGYLNDDGIDPDGCEDVLIEDCYIETHDDAIAIKAGRDQDAWERMPAKNIVIRNCTLNSGVNSFAIGSEMSGGVENVYVENCRLMRGRHGLNFKTNLDRGGSVQKIFFRNIEADSLTEALFIFRMDYHGYRGNHFPTSFSDFYAEKINCAYAGKTAIKLAGVPDAPLKRIFLKDLDITSANQVIQVDHARDILFEEVVVNGKTIELDEYLD